MFPRLPCVARKSEAGFLFPLSSFPFPPFSAFQPFNLSTFQPFNLLCIHSSRQFRFCCFKGKYFFAQTPGRSSRGNVDAEWHERNIQAVEIKVSRFLRFPGFLRLLGFFPLSTFHPFTLSTFFCLPVPPPIRKSSPWLALNFTHASPKWSVASGQWPVTGRRHPALKQDLRTTQVKGFALPWSLALI